jgi:hypothetical protein
MANYIAWFGKKRARLAECETQFAELLRLNASHSQIAEGADTIRAAQIRALKAKLAQLPPQEQYAVAVDNLNCEIQFWINLPAEELIEGYRSGKLGGHRREKRDRSGGRS